MMCLEEDRAGRSLVIVVCLHTAIAPGNAFISTIALPSASVRKLLENRFCRMQKRDRLS